MVPWALSAQTGPQRAVLGGVKQVVGEHMNRNDNVGLVSTGCHHQTQMRELMGTNPVEFSNLRTFETFFVPFSASQQTGVIKGGYSILFRN